MHANFYFLISGVLTDICSHMAWNAIPQGRAALSLWWLPCPLYHCTRSTTAPRLNPLKVGNNSMLAWRVFNIGVLTDPAFQALHVARLHSSPLTTIDHHTKEVYLSFQRMVMSWSLRWLKSQAQATVPLYHTLPAMMMDGWCWCQRMMMMSNHQFPFDIPMCKFIRRRSRVFTIHQLISMGCGCMEHSLQEYMLEFNSIGAI